MIDFKSARDLLNLLITCTMASYGLTVVLLCLATVCLANHGEYSGDVLVKCSGLQRDAIQHLVEADGVDVWHVGASGSIDFRVKSEEFQEMKCYLPECREEGSVEELLREIEQRTKQLNQMLVAQTQREEWFQEYHEYDEIILWYNQLSVDYPDLVTFIPSIGKSLEGREMPAVHITGSSSTPKSRYYFQCQIHAREWISGATCMYIANYLAENYGKEDRIKSLLDQTEFVIVPLVNPDGYADKCRKYTWSGSRLWRKNRRPGVCYGVDLNRNYPDHWGEGGSSDNPCSEVYHGESAASEPETRNTINYFKSLTSEEHPLYGAIDWHSYGQLILRPYGWTNADSPDEAQLKDLGTQMSNAILQVHGKKYVSEKSIGLYPTTGSADDWFYSDSANELNGKYRSAAYTIELRDTGSYGFLLPPYEIIPTGQEVFEAVMVFVENLNKNPLIKKQ